jgi:hypothetical protein
MLFKGIYNHDNPSEKGCIFDFMQNKLDILKSMRANAICDDCKRDIRKHETKLSESQFLSIDTLLTKAGSILNSSLEKKLLKIQNQEYLLAHLQKG